MLSLVKSTDRCRRKVLICGVFPNWAVFQIAENGTPVSRKSRIVSWPIKIQDQYLVDKVLTR